MPKHYFLLPLLFLFLAGPGYAQFLKKPKSKKTPYQEISFEDLMRRYMDKEISPLTALEGIYSVSCIITKRGRNVFGNETERVIERKDNYARVAILRDPSNSKRDFIEVSMSYREADKYPVMGEFTLLSEGRGLIYKHIEPDGEVYSFSMTHETDLIEGEFSKEKRHQKVTYRLSYLKIYPKVSDLSLGLDH